MGSLRFVFLLSCESISEILCCVFSASPSLLALMRVFITASLSLSCGGRSLAWSRKLERSFRLVS